MELNIIIQKSALTGIPDFRAVQKQGFHIAEGFFPGNPIYLHETTHNSLLAVNQTFLIRSTL